jgi:predicted NBD/HSP70 family sugar kinase
MRSAVENSATIRSSGTNLTRAKSHNFSVILEVVRTQGPISRAAIATITSLSRQTVQNIVCELEEAKLVRLTPGVIRGRGHPGMDISLNPEGAVSIGMHVDRQTLTAVACDLDGKIIWTDNRPFRGGDVTAANQTVLEVLAAFRGDPVMGAIRLLGACIAAPGPFGRGLHEVVDTASFRELGDEANVAMLTESAGIPIVIENDATAAAVGEWLYGMGKGATNLAVLHIGRGLGAGFILGGAPFRGRTKSAGEIGHVVVRRDGLLCTCGNKGCLERYLSVNALSEHLGLAADDPESLGQIAALCHSRDSRVTGWVNDVAEHFRRAINVIETMLDPDTIVVGGLVPDILLDELISAAAPLYEQIAPPSSAFPRVQRGSSGPLTVALGAAAVATDAHFAPSISRLVL